MVIDNQESCQSAESTANKVFDAAFIAAIVGPVVASRLNGSRTARDLNLAGLNPETMRDGKQPSSDGLLAKSRSKGKPALIQVPKKDEFLQFREASEWVEKVVGFASRHNCDKSVAFRLAFRFGAGMLDMIERQMPGIASDIAAGGAR